MSNPAFLARKSEINQYLSGVMRIRTADPLHAMEVLYQLSYNPL